MAQSVVLDRLPVRRVITAVLITGGLLWLGLGAASGYVERTYLAPRFVQKGDGALRAANYADASHAYTRAEAYGASVAERKACAEQAAKSPRACLTVFTDLGASQQLALLSRAAEGETPKQHLAVAVQLLQEGQPSYAQYAVAEALALDPTYPEALQYQAQILEKLR